MVPLFVTLACACAQAELPAESPAGVPALSFPAALLSSSPTVVELALDESGVLGLTRHSRVRLQALPWADGVDLELEQRSVPVRRDALHVDGRRAPAGARAGASFWTGQVADDPASDAFVAFVAGAAWGWVQREGELVHIVSGPDRSGDWSRGTTYLISEDHYLSLGVRPLLCETVIPDQARPARRPRVPQEEAVAQLEPRLVRGDLAIETDWQFFQIFGDLAVAEGYVHALLAAANIRFEKQLRAVLVTNYIGLHTTPADPWTSQETAGSTCFDLLHEFQAAWQLGGAPVAADLHHFMSGVDLGCGVAFLDALCDEEESFSVMSRMDGLTPFPVAVSPLNWDFVWMCHELGHNLGSVHTHQYCPPLDECSPAGFWGDCQDEMACTSRGTMMSYCHACPGGMANFTTWFHPVAALRMRAAVRASCFRPFVKR